MEGVAGVEGPAPMFMRRGLTDVRIGAGVEVEGPAREEVILIRFGLCLSTSFDEPAVGPNDPGRGRAWKGGRGGDRSFQSVCM